MGRIRIGCQTYTWEMLGPDWRGSLRDIIAEVADAGYEGIEISSVMLGDEIGRPLEVSAMLAERGLRLAALAYSAPSGFTEADAYEADIRGAERALAFLRHFPEPVLGLAGAGSPNKDNHFVKIDQACRFYNAVGKLAREAGVRVNVHPHSHHGSLLETEDEYDYLLERLDSCVALGPDSGHIVRGGQQLVPCVRKHAARIGHIHFKDVRGREWTPVGRGDCDFAGVVRELQAVGYDGWIIAEEEATWTPEGRKAILPANRLYIEGLLSQ